MIVKICGLREAAHACAAADAGADMLGLMLAPSRRQVQISDVVHIREALERRSSQGRGRPQLVGVFVNAAAREIRAALAAGLDAAQLSGDEPLDCLDELEGVALIKAVRLAGGAGERDWIEHGPGRQVRLLVDAHVPGSYGGTGVTGDWSGAAQLAQQLPILLAGGLTPENVGAAVRNVRPWGVDVSSGVETDGSKDIAKIRAFIAAARAV
jgi:phosphoribosylanthranilate isomerase